MKNKTITDRREIKNMIAMNCNSDMKLDNIDFITDDIYSWHISEMQKLLERVMAITINTKGESITIISLYEKLKVLKYNIK